MAGVFGALSARERRSLLVGAYVLAALLLARAALDAARRLGEQFAVNQVRADVLARRMARPHSRVLVDSLTRVRATRDAMRRSLLPGGTSALVSSQLSDVIREAAAAVGLTLLSSRTETDSLPTTPLVRAMIEIEAEGDVSNVLQFLLLVESSAGRLTLRSLSLTPVEPFGTDDRAEAIRLSASIEGFGASDSPDSRR